ncbi:MAG: integrase family protein [Parcubacteria group bacterium Licking1014_1]|nr:MAG: integrase family protein [Parcubacteria group bacterium Licking1014_1]
MEQSVKPLEKHINDFLDYCDVEKGLRSNTQKNYQEYLKKFFRWLKYKNLEGLLPHQLAPEHIWEYRLYLSRYQNPKSGKSLKKTTQNYYLIALRAFLAYFIAKDIVSLPPGKITLPKPDKSVKTVKFLSLEQIEKLLTTAEPKDNIRLRDRAILETFFSTGLRIAELVSLDVEQFANIKNKKDFELGVIGKGGNPRTVYFSERALGWIKKYLENRKDRDSYATDLLTQGVDLRTIQEFLGHRSIMTTQIYTHVTNKRLRDIHRQFHSGKNLKE